MGRKRWSRKKKDEDKAVKKAKLEVMEQKSAAWGGDKRDLKLIPNEKFDAYYRAQNLMPADEWVAFEKAIRSDLPIAFRLVDFNGHPAKLLKRLEEGDFGSPGTEFKLVDGTGVCNPPQKMEWYPNSLGWNINIARKKLKHCPELDEFRKFLQSETAQGNVCRQEAVSMLPPLLLGVEPHHYVLDMCAAPGSKTSQMLESVHTSTDAASGEAPGVVIANDADGKRAYMLVHQLKRFSSPFFLVTTHEGQSFPTLFLPQDGTQQSFEINRKDGSQFTRTTDRKVFKFDRILCDVPCSGDGTLRKNPILWKTWDPHMAVGLHNLQLAIAIRGLQMLKPGGMMCYSTCSLNPIEDEAVVAEILRRCKGTVKLVDVSAELPGLVRNAGLSTWQVYDKDMVLYNTKDDVPDNRRQHIRPSMFPPSPEEAKEFSLHHSFRILPHKNNTGGFFVAMLTKVQEPTFFLSKGAAPWDGEPVAEEGGENTDSTACQPAKKKVRENRHKDGDLCRAFMKGSCNYAKCRFSHDTPAAAAAATAAAAAAAAAAGAAAAKQENKEEGEKGEGDAKSGASGEGAGDKGKSKVHKGGFIEDPFLPVPGEVFQSIRNFYGLQGLEQKNLFGRSSISRKVYYLASSVSDAITNPNNAKLKVVHTGLRCFESRTDANSKECSCVHRVVQEGVYHVAKFMTKQIVRPSFATLQRFLAVGFLRTEDIQDEQLCAQLRTTTPGSVVFQCDDPEALKHTNRPPCVCVWRTTHSITLMMSKEEKTFYRTLLDCPAPPNQPDDKHGEEQEEGAKELEE